jgi:ribose transport system permease protein
MTVREHEARTVPPEATPASATRRRSFRIPIPAMSIVGPLVVLVAMIVFFSQRNSAFTSTLNLQTLGQQGAELLLVSLAAMLVILLGSIDLSVGASVTISGMSLAYFSGRGASVAILVVVCVAVGVGVGVINSLLYVYARIPSFLATLGMLFLLPGLAQQLYGAQPQSLEADGLINAIEGTIAGIPVSLVLALVALLVVAAALSATTWGRHVYAVGGNERVAQLSGIDVARTKIVAFTLGGALCGLAGLLLTVRITSATADMGSGLLLPSIAAVVIGGTPLTGGVGGPLRTLLGVALLTVLVNGMQVMSLDPFTQQIVQGLVVIAAVGIAAQRRRQRRDAIVK